MKHAALATHRSLSMAVAGAWSITGGKCANHDAQSPLIQDSQLCTDAIVLRVPVFRTQNWREAGFWTTNAQRARPALGEQSQILRNSAAENAQGRMGGGALPEVGTRYQGNEVTLISTGLRLEQVVRSFRQTSS